jgi:hypothetical protein
MTPEEQLQKAVADAKAQAALELAITSLTEEVKRLAVTVERNNEKLERLSALESNHNNTNQAIGRAFDEIEELKGLVDDVAKSNGADHKTYDKYIWMCVGFVTAISVIWTIVGYRMNSMIDKTVESVARFEQHIATDKMMSESDVRHINDARSKP